MHQHFHNPQRRQLLVGSARALAAAHLATWSLGSLAQTAGAKPLPAYLGWKDQGSMIVHSATTVETARAVAGASIVTPAIQLYIRNNLPAPDATIVANRDAWEVSITGVKNPRKLTVADLKKMGEESLPMVLQCSGNGRGFFPNKPSGKWAPQAV